MDKIAFSIGQLARATGVKPVTIRYYERVGLLPMVSRNASGYRKYSEAARNRLLFIRRCRALGFGLDDIRELLELAGLHEDSCARVDGKVAAQLDQVRVRIHDLQDLERELERLLSNCHGGIIDECRIIESLSRRACPSVQPDAPMT
ncbi:MerR family transcriptional regulator [Allopusillimonas soli]|uniref:Helix-turn-helix domain-containing protein n=1 Tax=Allopusillimonas soli TaxID=659016 RepID=A0A853F8V4_9BURK|nr:helix-turn-helix domain-containing protein [Allopusillimonas soli]NYT37094.1 helix-turn-helix domain-containing protein [Allopusillimonas soli]TEA75528.1 MerR family transcriptional regulator [Allopusillimonas soli]